MQGQLEARDIQGPGTMEGRVIRGMKGRVIRRDKRVSIHGYWKVRDIQGPGTIEGGRVFGGCYDQTSTILSSSVKSTFAIRLKVRVKIIAQSKSGKIFGNKQEA